MSNARPDTPRALSSLADLAEAGLVARQDLPDLAPVEQEFRIRLTAEMQGAIIGPEDPVSRQFLPSRAESITRPEELLDPIGDAAHSPVAGLTHRYPDRVILHITKTCDVYCRFCFRRETVGETGPLPESDLSLALDHIARTEAIREVVLTGGDPLTLSPRRIGSVLTRLRAIPHLTQIRFHTRVPVVAPYRITQALTETLAAPGPAIWIVLHTNHADELTGAARNAIARIVDAGVPMLSQSVLLHGVNDDAETLATLFTALTALRVKPYYLHHCDLARGTSHFRTTIDEGRTLMRALRGRITGTALPTYVLDIPGGFGKVPVTLDHFRAIAPGLWDVTDWQGVTHRYKDPAR